MRVPVVLIVFNRPDLTRLVLNAIASAGPRKLFVVADGPRVDRPDDERLVAETRAVIDQIDWPFEVAQCYSDSNLGCTARITSGLDWVFARTPEAIILDDDCLPHPSFFPYCEELLHRYRDSPDVQMISGTNAVEVRGPHSYHFSRTFNVWGWATWERSWRHYDDDMSAWRELRETDWLERLLRDDKGARVARTLLDATYEGRMPWDFHWTFQGWLRRAISAVPSVNLVTNIGFGEGATHERNAGHPDAGRPVHPMKFPLSHPPRAQVLQEADTAIWEAMDRRVPDGVGTVVMGSAVGLAAEQVLPFIDSLANCDYEGDLVLFVNRRLARELRTRALPGNVRLIPARTLLPFNFARVRQSRMMWPLWVAAQTVAWAILRALGRRGLEFRGSRRIQRFLAKLTCTPMEARFLNFHEFLQGHAYHRVLVTDVRDVLFQGDPFTQLTAPELAVSIETRSYTIATERHNRGWIEKTYGSNVLERIGGNPPSCVGVTYGGGEAMSSYLDRMVDEILRLRSRTAREGGADTAIHNLLLWTGQLGSAQLMEALGPRSAVATLNEIPEEDLALDSEGRLLNRDGSAPSVVHQYDRQPRISQRLLRALTSGDRPTP